MRKLPLLRSTNKEAKAYMRLQLPLSPGSQIHQKESSMARSKRKGMSGKEKAMRMKVTIGCYL
jgi:hypothetical protein